MYRNFKLSLKAAFRHPSKTLVFFNVLASGSLKSSAWSQNAPPKDRILNPKCPQTDQLWSPNVAQTT